MNKSITLLFILSLSIICFQSFAQQTSEEVFYERGINHHDNNELSQAVDYYTASLRQNPNSTRTLFNRGLVYFQQGKYHKSINDFNLLLALEPADGESYEHRGRAKLMIDDFEGAAADYTSAIHFNPHSSLLYLNRGTAHGNAIRLYNETVEVDATNEQAYNNRANLYLKLGKYDVALRDYNKSISLNPNTDSYTNRAFYWLEIGEYDKALQDCKNALTINQNNLEAYVCMGLVKLNQKSYGESIEFLDYAIERGSSSEIAYNGRGEALLEKGYPEYAIDDFTRAIQVDEKAIHYFNRGNANMKINLLTAAINDFEKTLELETNYKGAKANIKQCKKYQKENK